MTMLYLNLCYNEVCYYELHYTYDFGSAVAQW